MPQSAMSMVERGLEGFVFYQHALALGERGVGGLQSLFKPVAAMPDVLRAGVVGAIGEPEREIALVKKIVMENDAPFVPLVVERQRGETQLFAKEVKVEGKRYIVCRNEAEAEKDRKDRETIVTALDAQLKKGDKALVGNSAYRRYLRKTPEMKHRPAFEIDPGKLAQEARFDGIFVLRTNAKITPLQAVLRYRDLLKIENLFLRTKAVM